MALQTAEPQQLTNLAVLAAGGETRGGYEVHTNWSKGAESIKIANDLRKVQSEGGKHTLERGLAVKEGEVLFNLHNAPNFINRFGGEHARNPTSMTPEEKASYLKAKDIIKQNTFLSLFLEARTMPNSKRDAHINKIMTEYGYPASSYSEIRKQALESIANSSAFIGMFPEVTESFVTVDTAPQPGVLQFIEDTLVPSDDQRLASRLGTRMHDAYKKVVGLSPVGTDEERAEIVKQIKLGEETIKVKRKLIVDTLKAKGIRMGGAGNFTEADIDGIITAGGTPDMSGDTLVQQLYLKSTAGVTLADYDSMKLFADLPKQITAATDRIKAKLAPSQTLAAYRAAKPSDPDVMDEKATEMMRLGYLMHYGPAGGKRLQYENFSKNFLPLLEQNSLSAVAREMRQAQIQLEDSNIRKNILPPTTVDVERSRDLRILAEEDLLGEIDGILGQSIKDVLSERYDVMEERMGRTMQEKADKSDKDVKINIMNLKKKMSENWIKYDATTRKKIVDKKQIKTDVTHLAYAFDKDVALKQLIARDLFNKPDFEKINVIDGTATPPAVPPVQILDAEQIKQMEAVFKEAGTEYRDKLFADMFAARTFTDRTFNFGLLGEKTWGDLGFKRDEWKYMMQRYEPEITKGIEANHDAHQALKTLESQGVKVDFSMKWLLYVLAVLLGIGSGGAAAALSPAISLGAGVTAGVGAELAAAKVLAGKSTTDINGNVNTMA